MTVSKRLFELFLIAVSSPLLLTLFLLVGLVTAFALGFPVIFRQARPGRGGRIFQIYKFRTMTDARDADGELLPDHLRLNRFGAFLRSTSLDELPSVLNVVKGEMALVGPRPLLPEYLSLYSPEQARRHDVRPGVTGWAQVQGRNRVPWEERLRQDVWYVDNRSLWLDIRILGLTIGKVIRREGISDTEGPTMTRFTKPGS